MRGQWILLTIAAVSLVTVSAVSADVLWDQSDFDPAVPGFFNTDSGAPPFGITQFAVNDVEVGGAGWVIESISTYYSALDPVWGLGITQAYLHIYTKLGPLPLDGTDDPTASPLVAATGTLNGDHWLINASGLSVAVPPGPYWIGLTPIAPSGPFGPEIHMSSMTLIDDSTASYDPFAFPPPPMWFNFNPGFDASLLIEGMREDPVPVESATWGSIKGLYN